MRSLCIYTVMLRYNVKNLQRVSIPVGSYSGRIYIKSLLLCKKRLTAILRLSPV